jgi:hypothetical protein
VRDPASQHLTLLYPPEFLDDVHLVGRLSFFKFVWFESKECTTPAFVATRVEEIVSVVDGCTRHQDPIGTEWLERVVSTVEVEELEKCIAALAERISVIHNISVKGSSHPVKPSEFNDFETRCIQLIPVLRTLQCISKVSPQAVAVSQAWKYFELPLQLHDV